MAGRDKEIPSEIVSDVRAAQLRAKKDGDVKAFVRFQAVLMVGERMCKRLVASICNVHVTSVRGWTRLVLSEGAEALFGKDYPGATPRLSEEEKERLQAMVAKSPEEAGFDTGVWTGPLVKKLIAREFGVKYDVSHVRRILHDLGFSLQYPRVRLSKANKAKQQEWLEKDLPRIKKGRQRRRSVDV